MVILVDGLAPAFVDKVDTPTFDRLAREGVKSDHLIPVYPTVSMSNHTSFTTGCWPENHGILSNRFIDPERGLYDSSLDADWRTGCESIFEAAERQGVTSAAIGITGFASSSKGKRATFVSKETKWSDYPSDTERANEVVRLLRKPKEERPSLIVVYFQEPDHSIHYDTSIVRTLMSNLDAAIGKVLNALGGLPDDVEKALFIGADHGHKPVEQYVNIKRILNKHDIEADYASSGASSFLYFKNEAAIDAAFTALSDYEFLNVYRSNELPSYARIGKGSRVGDLLVQAKPPYWLEDPDQFPDIVHWLGMTHIWPVAFQVPTGGLQSTHGYPPDVVEMHGAFYAWGDGIKRAITIDTLNQVDVHPTVASWLGIDPGTPVDGTVIESLFSSQEKIE
ncbi:alkaline phosphatase family protein [Kordiimonas aquimaris]|uniref:alkaline phosphatase family protein n=1 Tax=Kordiimonas aquimaris TaxID=707591 RepID=UPI0021CF1E5D|nr:ectonucleotide pyrophosphatase/phosphodiesterase [Kordiimonas aquimaris]